jgi:uncharacterized protein YndB with AHSA1/START domain
MPELSHHLDRTVLIHAHRDTVFRFFTDSARWAAWWGAGSTIDPRPGGRMYIRPAGGSEVMGEVVEIDPPERIAFTYGYASGQPIPPGASKVTIRIEADPAGSILHLRHEFADAAARDLHIQGWRFQLSLFANVVANEAFAGATETVDAWFAAWTIADAAARDETLARIALPEVRFADRYSLLQGLEDLSAHIAAALRFMPGVGLERKGNVRHCQGSVLADWTAAGPNGAHAMAGTTYFRFHPDGRIESATGFTNLP